MFHPNHLLQIAHTRERELVKEAEACGLPKAEAESPRLSKQILAIALGITTLATLLRLVIQ